MGIFGESKYDHLKDKVGNLDNRLSNSFDRVKSDINNLFSWVQYQNQLIEGQNAKLDSLYETVESIPIDRDEIKKIIDESFNLDDIKKRFNDLLLRVKSIEMQHGNQEEITTLKVRVSQLLDKLPAISTTISDLNSRMVSLESSKISSLESHPIQNPSTKVSSIPRLQEKVVKSVARSSKDYVKGIILSLIKKYHDVTALKLREIVVEEQALVSKSSFYRLLEELEQENSLEVVRVGKEKHYSVVENALSSKFI